MDGSNKIHTGLNSNLMRKYKEQGIDIEKSRNDAIDYFRIRGELNKLHEWDKEFYHTVFNKEYYDNIT